MREPKFLGYMWEDLEGAQFWGHKPKEEDEILKLLDKMIHFEMEMDKRLSSIEDAIHQIMVIIEAPPPPPPPPIDNSAMKIIFDCKILLPEI